MKAKDTHNIKRKHKQLVELADTLADTLWPITKLHEAAISVATSLIDDVVMADVTISRPDGEVEYFYAKFDVVVATLKARIKA